VSKKLTTAFVYSVLWITISAILIWRKKLCSPCRTPSGQKCNLCLRNVLLPMSPERTISNLVGVSRFELRMLHHSRNEQRRARRARFQAPDAGTANDRVRDLRKHEIQ